MRARIVAALAVAFLGLQLAGCGVNTIPTEEERAKAAWSEVLNQYQRRADLIPNLVETVKGYMAHEKDTLERVIQARNQALQAQGVHEKAQAEAAGGAALTGFFGLAEAYPDLKANTNMLSLQEELKGTENKIAFSRQYYNDIVTSYNTKIETFPSSIFASMGGFKPKELFELEDASQREPVKVQF